MQPIKWRDGFNTGIEEIDNQHKSLVDTINKLYENITGGNDNITLNEIFVELFDYANHHFTTEENYMLRFNFDGYQEHKAEHDYFKERINKIRLEYPMSSDEMKIELMNFLRDWLINHLLEVDKGYVTLFKLHGLS